MSLGLLRAKEKLKEDVNQFSMTLLITLEPVTEVLAKPT